MGREYQRLVNIIPPDSLESYFLKVFDFEDSFTSDISYVNSSYIARLDPDSAFGGGLGVKIKTGATTPTNNDSVVIRFNFPFTRSRGLLASVPFRIVSDPATAWILFTSYAAAVSDGKKLTIIVKIQGTDGKVYVWNSAGVYEEVGTLNALTQNQQLVMTLEIDAVNNKYKRLIIGSQEFSVSAISLPKEAAVYQVGGFWQIQLVTKAAANAEMDLDNVAFQAIVV